MATDMLQYLDPDGLDETVLNIGQIKTNLEGQISDLEESIEEEMQDLPYARPDGLYPNMTVGAVIGADETAQWAQRVTTGSGAATVRSVQGAAEVIDGELVPVLIAGIKGVGFNQWDEEWELGTIGGTTGQNVADSNTIRSKNYNSCIPSTSYYIKAPVFIYVFWYDAGKNYISKTYTRNSVSQSPANAAYFRIRVDGTTTYNHDICINVSNPALNGQYKPYMTDAIEWTAQTLRAAGSVADVLYSDHVDVRVGERAYQSGDESDATVRTDGTTTYYPLTTPTTTPISPALPMTYKVQAGGSESIIVPAGEVSAAPMITIAEPVNAGDEFARIWAAIESLGYTRNAAQLSRPISLTDIGSVDKVQKDTTDVVEKEAAEVAEIDTVKEVQE